ncbi:MAG: hypothetical protein JXA69_20140 [Phycisphaerae bacterium]|nr:hypothetical protein [Phycisphaerae bacterium]
MATSQSSMSPGGVKAAPVAAPRGFPPIAIERRWPVLALAAVSYLLSLRLFEPGAIRPLGYVVFVPWIIAICLSSRTVWLYLVSFLLGLAFWATHWHWLYQMSPLVLAVAGVILAAPFPLVAWPVRHLYRRRGMSLTIVFPMAWTASELFRMRGFFGAPLCLLAHSQVRFASLIQIADLVGALGVTFVVAMVNGWLADLVLHLLASRRAGRFWQGSPRLLVCSLLLVLVLSATVLYGRARLAFDGTTAGPRVAVVQNDFPINLGDPTLTPPRRPASAADDEIDHLWREKGEDWTADARLAYLHTLNDAAQTAPYLMVLPESVWSMVLNREFRESPLGDPERTLRMQLQHEEFVGLVRQYHAALVVGATSIELQPPGDFPGELLYNSAFFYKPGVVEPDRYDKISPVLFGEHLPFRCSQRFFWLYRLLNDGPWNPWGHGGIEYVVTPGRDYTVFSLPARSPEGRSYCFATAICLEDTLPQLYRRFVVDSDGRKRVDFMLTISNARWFGQGNQQAQHLVDCAFRAVENRIWIARSSDGGISGFINSDGTWRDLVGCHADNLQPGGGGYRLGEARIDPRVTLYSRCGDWLAWICLGLVVAAMLDAIAAATMGGHPRPVK